jgi:hypothetical protein
MTTQLDQQPNQQPKDETLSAFLFSTTLTDIEVISYGTTKTLAIAPNISFKCGDSGYLNFVIGFDFKNVYQVCSKFLYCGWEGMPDFKVYLCEKPGIVTKADTCVISKFDPRDGYCQVIFSLIMKEFKLTQENVIHLFHYLGGRTFIATREYWSVVNLKIAAHNQLIDDGLDIGQVFSIKVSRGKCYVKYSLPNTQGTQKGSTILGIKKLMKNSRNHLDLTPILDNYEYENKKYSSQSPFLGFNVILNSHNEHDGYILPTNNGWVKIERNRNLKSESIENNKFINTNLSEFKLTLGNNFPLPVCADIYEAYISAREILKQDLDKDSLMDFKCNCIDNDYKLSFVQYHKNLLKQTEVTDRSHSFGLGFSKGFSKKKK